MVSCSSLVSRLWRTPAPRSATAPEGYDGRLRHALLRGGVPASLLALVVLAFGGTLGNGFVYDDQFLVVENSRLEQPASWPGLFVSGSWDAAELDTRTYRPLPMLTIALNRWWGGLDPTGFHVVNLLLHALAVGLLYRLARRLGLGRPVAWLAAALFAVHPLQTEPVSEIVGRMDLMAGAALLAALLAHLALRRRQREDRPAWIPAIAAPLLYAAGLLSKEHVFLFPVVAAVWDLRARMVPPRRWLPVYFAYGAVAAGYLTLRASVFGGELLTSGVSRLDNPLAHVGPALRAVSALAVAGRYLAHVAVPANLSPDYCSAQILPFESLTTPAALLTLAAALATVAAAILLARRSPRAALAMMLGAATFLPVSNLLFPIGTVMGDRLFYLPLAALTLLAGIGAQRLFGARPRALATAAALVLAPLTWASVAQSRHWRDSFTLSQQTVKAAPRCARGHSNLGYDRLERGEIESAATSFTTALSLYPELPKAEVGLAMVALQRPDDAAELRRAAERLERAMTLDPRSTAAIEVAAEVARRRGDLSAARGFWVRRLERDPRHAPTLSNLAILEWNAGRIANAIALWRRATEQPDAPAETWLNLGRALAATGARAEAEESFRQYEARRSATGPVPR